MYTALNERGARKESALREIEGVPQTVRLDAALADFDKEMKSLPAHVRKVILSAERCSIYLATDAHLQRLRDILAPYFDQVQVIIYLRRQDAHATSRYSQLLRAGTLRSPSLNNLEERYYEAYEYPALLDRWAHAFGRENIVPRIFQRDALVEGDAVHDFLSVCGIDRNFAAARDTSNLNPSINVQGQALLLAIGRALERQSAGSVSDSHEKVWRTVVNLVSTLHAGTGWRPSRAQAAAFMEHYAEGNEAIRQAWFPDRLALFDLDYSDLPEVPIALEMQDVLLASLDLVLAAMRDTVRMDVGISIAKAQAKLRNGRSAAAERLLKRAVVRDGKNPKVRMDLARFYADTGEFSLALAHAAMAVKLAPENDEARLLHRELVRAHPECEAAQLEE
jgi:tetratricopeptide (TPR) repeat protein